MTIKNKRIAKRACAVMLSLAMVASSLAPATSAEAAKKGKIKSVTVTNVNGGAIVLKKGEKFSLKAKVVRTGKVSKKLTYKSSNKKIVKVSSKGKLTAVKNGTAKITIKSKANKKKKAIVSVTVGTPVQSIKLDQVLASVAVGGTVKIAATVNPADATVNAVTWTSSDENIATVAADGTVTGKAAGNVKITATINDGRVNTASCDVVVLTPEEPKKEEPKKEEPKQEEPKKEDPKQEDPKEEIKVNEPTKLSMAGYSEVWKDEFNGTELNRKDWNVEVHEPGWVNAEWQAYVDEENSKNIVVKDGKLYLIPIKEGEGDSAKYTSGRVNTMGKHDFKYGLFEATLKVPAGKGYLPAFWMMPTNENLYGQWPKCGEIDAMEVMGQDTNLLYGTLHYGEPHGQQQGTAALKDGKYIAVKGDNAALTGNYAMENGKSYADEFHTYAVEWEPDHISWYVDGIKYHEVTDWFTAVKGGGEVAFPAPFDQPFYVILNLAVGGSWVGYPDDTTTYGEQSAMVIDSVKIYQKEASYYEKKEAATVKVEKEIVYKEADSNGNYVTNGNFATAIDSEKDWTLHLESEAAGTTCTVSNNSIKITPSVVGDQTHSIQLKQEGLPLYRGVEYTLSFDANADAERTMVIDIEGPERGWERYFNDTSVDLTTKNKTFTFDFTMDEPTNANCSLEFNLGKQGSTVPATISNVSLKVKDASGKVDESKIHEVRADGNYVYNGSFSEGSNADRTKYWEISEADKAKVSVTNVNNERRLKVVAPDGTTADNPVVVKQDNLPLVAGKYAISYKAYKDSAAADDKSLVITVGKAKINDVLTAEEKSYESKFEFAEGDSTTLTMKFTAPGTYYVDDIFVSEDALIKNGSFNAALAGFQSFMDSSGGANREYTVDSQNGEKNAYKVDIKNTGTEDWHIQLIQDGINLEKGKTYKLSFKAKSNMARTITSSMCHNGAEDDDWSDYSEVINCKLTKEYQPFETTFTMKKDDPVARFHVTLGAIGKKQITEPHSVFIDDIVLEEVEAVEIKTGPNLFKDLDYTAGSGWTTSDGSAPEVVDGKVTFSVAKADTYSYAWDYATEYRGFNLEKGKKYILSFKASSDVAKSFKAGIQFDGGSYASFGGGTVTAGPDEDTYEFDIVANKEPDATVGNKVVFFIQMGKVNASDSAASITISEPKLAEVLDAKEETNLLPALSGSNGWWGNIAPTYSDNSNSADVSITDVAQLGTEVHNVQLSYSGIVLKKDTKYKLTVKISSSNARKLKVGIQHDGYADGSNEYTYRCGNTETVNNEARTISYTFTAGEDDAGAQFYIQMGHIDGEEDVTSNITISDPKLVEVKE